MELEKIFDGLDVEQMARASIQKAEAERAEIEEERFLFGWDLCLYKWSNEGKAFSAAMNGGNIDEIRKAAAAYYEARNGAGVHYDDEQELEQARRDDRALAEYFREID